LINRANMFGKREMVFVPRRVDDGAKSLPLVLPKEGTGRREGESSNQKPNRGTKIGASLAGQGTQQQGEGKRKEKRKGENRRGTGDRPGKGEVTKKSRILGSKDGTWISQLINTRGH